MVETHAIEHRQLWLKLSIVAEIHELAFHSIQFGSVRQVQSSLNDFSIIFYSLSFNL
jgi:hypothetical protein